METFDIRGLTFSYPEATAPALFELDLQVRSGEFLTICGPSGCGKSTLLRQLKPLLAPHGIRLGEIWFEGTPLSDLDERRQAAEIGFVLQSPDNQVVTDKVWHELAFGLESLGLDLSLIHIYIQELKNFLINNRYKYIKVRCSYGLQGWILAKEFQVI